MKTLSLLQAALRGGIAAAIVTLLPTAPLEAAGPKAFQFLTSGANTSGGTITLDHPAINGKSKLNLIAMHSFNANYNNHPIGLRYNATLARWQLRNEDGAAFSLGETYNLLLAPGAKRFAVSPFTTSDYIAYFPTLAKNKPNNLLLATHLINSGNGYSGVTLTDAFSTYNENGIWSIYNDNFAPAKAVAFNIVDVTKLKAGGVPVSFLFTASGANIVANQGVIDNPLTNNKPNAVVFARHVWTVASPTYLTKEVGVWYDGTRWTIFTEDTSPMPENTAFAVTVIPQATP